MSDATTQGGTIRAFTRHPTAANLLMLGLIVLGVIALPKMQRETFPEFGAHKVRITIVYPGASADQVEEAICVRVEDAISGVGFVEEVVAEAREGVGQVVVEMSEGGDEVEFLNELKTEVEAIDDFPERIEDPVLREEPDLGDKVIALAVSGPEDPAQLKAYCESLKRKLRQEPGISQVELKGFSDHHLRVHVRREALLQHSLSLEQLAQRIEAQSLSLPAGSIQSREGELLIRFDDERRSPQELADLVVVGAESGGELRLGDLGEVIDTFELDEDQVTFNGKRAGLLQIEKAQGEDVLRVFASVQAFKARVEESKPKGVELTLTEDMASNVQDRLDMLVTNGWQGLLLVFGTLALFFAVRFSFWVALGLPVSFLGAFFFFPLIGYSINMITMVALLLALGLLMDDAIVIAENVIAHRKRGKSPLAAAVDGTEEVKWGVTSSFLTTVAVFAPLSTMAGDIGDVLGVMPVVLLLVLGVSLIEAFLILPNHLSHALNDVKVEETHPTRLRIEAALDWLREVALGKPVAWCVRYRYLTLGLAGLAFCASAACMAGGLLKFRAFPDIEGDVVQARVLLPQGTPLARTAALTRRLEAAVREVAASLPQPGGKPLVRDVSVRFNTNRDAYEQGPHVATVSVDLLGTEERATSIDELIRRWREAIGSPADVISLKYAEPSQGPAGRAIDVRLKGEDLDRLRAASLETREFLNRFEGVNDLGDDLRPGKPTIRLRLREGAVGMGLTGAAVAGQLRVAFYGATAATPQVGPESYEVDLRLAPEDRDAEGDLEAFRIALPDGRQVPLQAVARIERERGWARIARVDGVRTVSVQGDVDTSRGNTGEIMGALEREWLPRLRERFPDVRVSLEGEAKEGAKTGSSLRFAFGLGLIGVFLILSFQFRSYLEPLLVMGAIPLALIGVIWGHVLLGLDLSMPSMVGFVSLAGVVVNDSILLLLFLRAAMVAGQPIEEACAQASRDRFRAILLTSVTTIAGLTPLLMERSSQAQVLIPLAASIVFGMLASTVLVLVVIPCGYGVLHDLGLTRDPREDEDLLEQLPLAAEAEQGAAERETESTPEGPRSESETATPEADTATATTEPDTEAATTESDTATATPEADTEGSTPEADTEGSKPEADAEAATPEADTEGSKPETDTEGSKPEADTEGARAEADTEGATPEADTEGATPEPDTEGARAEPDTEGARAEPDTEGSQPEPDSEGPTGRQSP